MKISIATNYHYCMVDYSVAKNLDFLVLHYTGYGKEYPKSKKISPDGFIQLILQWTFYRYIYPSTEYVYRQDVSLSCHGHLTSTYESAGIRKFRLGRVDNIRSATPEVLDWVQQMEDFSTSQVRIDSL